MVEIFNCSKCGAEFDLIDSASNIFVCRKCFKAKRINIVAARKTIEIVEKRFKEKKESLKCSHIQEAKKI